MKNIKIYSLGCRLNALEAEKIRAMLVTAESGPCVIINTCSVTGEAGRQSGQAFRRILRENPGIPVFVTGCEATRCPDRFAGATVVPNNKKFDPAAYGVRPGADAARVSHFDKMQKKGFVRIQDGCDRHCTYCITRLLRGPSVSMPYTEILADARALLDGGYTEIILTGINIAEWTTEWTMDNGQWTIGDLCRHLLADLPDLPQLTLSSLDPAANIKGIIDLIRAEPRMTRHLHLSVQSGSDQILRAMARRHTAQTIRDIHEAGRAQFPSLGGVARSDGVVVGAGTACFKNHPALRAPLQGRGTALCTPPSERNCALPSITFSWDIICGFPGETDELFAETLALARELRPTKIHAFPFSARPGTAAAGMPDQVPRAISRDRVKRLTKDDF